MTTPADPTAPSTQDLADPLFAGANLFVQKAQKEALIASLQQDIVDIDAAIVQLAQDIGPLSQQLQAYVQTLGSAPAQQ